MEQNITVKAGERTHVCPDCGNTFKNNQTVTQCSHCGKNFGSPEMAAKFQALQDTNRTHEEIAKAIREMFGEAIDHHRPMPEWEDVLAVIKARQGDDHETAADTYLKGLIDFSGKNIPAEYRPNPQIQKWLDDAARKLSLASTMLNVLKHIEANPSLPTDPFYLRQIQALITKASQP